MYQNLQKIKIKNNKLLPTDIDTYINCDLRYFNLD